MLANLARRHPSLLLQKEEFEALGEVHGLGSPEIVFNPWISVSPDPLRGGDGFHAGNSPSISEQDTFSSTCTLRTDPMFPDGLCSEIVDIDLDLITDHCIRIVKVRGHTQKGMLLTGKSGSVNRRIPGMKSTLLGALA